MGDGRFSRIVAMMRSLSAFTFLQLVAFIAPFLALPVIARVAGPAEWVHLAVAQAIGSLGAIVILFGWWTSGPAEYYRLDQGRDRLALYRRSLFERMLVAAVTMPVVVVIVVLISPPEAALLCVLASLASMTYGFTPDWYFIAQNRPGKLAVYETIPRASAIGLAVPAIILTGELLWYPGLQLAMVAIGYMAMLRREVPRDRSAEWSTREAYRSLRVHIPIAASNILGGLYSQLSLPLASLLLTAPTLAPFVSGDKLYKAARFSIVALGNSLQSWTLSAESYRRHAFAVAIHLWWGLLGGALIAGLTPLASELLFGESLRSGYSISVPLGVAFFCTSLTTPLVRNILIPSGARRVPLTATAGATLVGIGSMWPLSTLFGVAGIAIAIAASEAVSALINALGAVPHLKRLRSERDGPPGEVH